MIKGGRHYGLDWLRVAAFGLLILYHIGMVFAPWDWVVKSAQTYPQLIVPMALLTPWRLPLLFAVSGYASRKLFEKSPSVRGFVRSRSARLLIPLVFAMVFIVPPEMWVRVMEKGYPLGFLHFWSHDYWRVGTFYERSFPSVEHLWFVEYLWAYTMLLAGLLGWLGSDGAARLQRWFEWLSRGHRILWAPIALVVMLKLALLFVVPEKQGLFTDWAGHSHYVPIFLFGFALGGSQLLWAPIARHWRLAALIALLSGTIVVGFELAYQAHEMPSHLMMALDRSAQLVMAWSMIVTLLHIAETYWNRDHPWRATLGEAVFPFYIIHHPVIVVTAWFTLPLGLAPWTEFALLFGATASACLGFYLVGREINWLRPLIGLRARPRIRPVPLSGSVGSPAR
ncbi:glucan biosynthesis protein C [Sphingomonas sp. UYAg733]